MAKKLYHVHECIQNRDWFIIAKNKEEAQRLIIKEHTVYYDYDENIENIEWEFEFEKSDCFEVSSEVKIEKA